MTGELTDKLRQYESLKFELAEVLRQMSALIPRDLHAAHARLTDLFARLAEDRLNLIFVGRFNRGKTSLMNALLGSDRLPTGILPLTSAITSIAYGSTEKVQIEFEKGPFLYDIPLDALADYITEKGNPGNIRRIRQAHIALPAELLRRGFHFVDTPGLGSAIPENTRTTEGFFSEGDAVICVTAYDAPLTEEETQALQVFAAARLPTLIVVNKQDTVVQSEREEVLAYVRKQLQRMFPETTHSVMSVSAVAGLAAKRAYDPSALAESGLATLESELVRLLTEAKGRAVISGVCERAVSLLDELNSDDGNVLRERLELLRGRSRAPRRSAVPDVSVTPANRMNACGVCERVANGLFDFLRKYQHELAATPAARERLAAAGGLCPRHTWLYASISQDRDICLALTPLMKRIADELASLQRNGQRPSCRANVSPAGNALGGSCELCAVQRQLESEALQEIMEQVTGSDSTHYLPAVCLPHLRKLAAGHAGQAGDATRDLRIQGLARRLAPAAERLAEDMQRYVLRRDAIRHGLASEEETQAAKRALGFVAGSRVFPPQP